MGSYFSRRSEQKTIVVSSAVTKLVVVEETGTVEHVAPVVIGEKGTVQHVEPYVSGPTDTVERVEPVVSGETGTVEYVEPVVSGEKGTAEHVVTIISGDKGTVETITKDEIIQAFITPLTKLVEVEQPSDENVVSAKRHKKNHKKN